VRALSSDWYGSFSVRRTTREVGGGSRLDAADFVGETGELGGDGGDHLHELCVGEHFGVLAIVPCGGVLELLQHAVAVAGLQSGAKAILTPACLAVATSVVPPLRLRLRRGDQGRGRVVAVSRRGPGC
jgi:hypothetical protein